LKRKEWWMNRWRSGATLVAVLLFAACPRNGDREVTPDAVAVAPVHDPGAVPEATQSIPLEPYAGEAVRAEAVLVPVGVQTQFSIHVHQGPPNTSLTAHVLIRDCEQPGPLAADLQPVFTDAAGQGSSQIVVDLAADVVVNGNHVVQLRRANGREGIPVACGQIPAHPVLHGQ
jgi:hypothetical protein